MSADTALQHTPSDLPRYVTYRGGGRHAAPQVPNPPHCSRPTVWPSASLTCVVYTQVKWPSTSTTLVKFSLLRNITSFEFNGARRCKSVNEEGAPSTSSQLGRLLSRTTIRSGTDFSHFLLSICRPLFPSISSHLPSASVLTRVT